MSSPLVTSYTPTNWINGSLGNTPIDSDNLNKIENGIENSFALSNSMRVIPTAIKTGVYNPVIGDFALYNVSANIANQLPAAIPGSRIKVKKLDSTANTIQFNVNGSDTIDGTATTITLRYQSETRTLLGVAGGWLVIDGLNTMSTLDSRYLQQSQANGLYSQLGPYYLGWKSTVQSIPNAFNTEPFTPLTFDSEDFDTHNGHSTSTATSRYVVPATWAGIYEVTSNVIFNAGGSTNTRRIVCVAKNGARVRMGQAGTMTNNLDVAVSLTAYISCVPGDYLETTVFQDCGAALNVFASSTAASTSMFVRYVRSV